ncbi:hypothetical protein [Rhodopila globiformis]|uniref:Uncharacterized protein n=1 Tax=Rhodopila globiformis TaxID=1071 RepID=A0A2S6MU82_RHOGL|nr:hypothetical protein [Rhodopila globiformis]PPQ25924.1 hypothetical protein CCS01_31655 [Rhodopila globiformis]
MKISWSKIGTAAALLTALAWAPAAVAAQGPAQGKTSGPAAGTPTIPNTAAQKHMSSQADVGAGAPGVSAKRDTESGPAPRPPSGRKSASHQ